ncbi:MAG: DUF1464 family protein [Gemmatimonadales bacterium]|jgi:predicted butyrate kinase (DUF1464 family)|nr:DUF1464 family protein [Gemmatimonadales bacterium]
MPKVVGIDPGTVSIDVCGLAGGRLVLDRSLPTAEAVADPDGFAALLEEGGAPTLVAGLSGYGLPLTRAASASDDDLRLAFLAPRGEQGGIGGLRQLVRSLADRGLPVVLLPGVIHLDTVPAHRKVNRIDLGTADKLCAVALGIQEEAARLGSGPERVSFVLLELGGAFTSAIAVQDGQVVDGIGGSSGPIGWQSAGALDSEVAFLAGSIGKGLVFHGGVSTIAESNRDQPGVGFEAFVEGAVKAVRQLLVSAPDAATILVSGRIASDPAVRERLAGALADVGPLRALAGFAHHAKQGAQGAALIADGLAGGRHAALVERLRIREAAGSVLDHLYVITPHEARKRLGLPAT